jgi:UDP-glucose 4-epimerase
LKVAVTGVDGFLGQYLKELLQSEGIEIISVSRKAGYDIRQPASLSRMPGFDVVVHLAALSYVPDSYVHPHLFYETNVTGTLNVLEQVRRYKARIIYISSYIYGQPHRQPIDENHPVQPFNPYAQSKVMAEELCQAYQRDFGTPFTIFRPFNIYGPGQASHFLLPKLVSQHMHGDEVTVFDVRPKRDYIFVTDVARAILKAVKNTDQQDNNVYNLGSGQSFSIPAICDILEQITGKELRLKILNQQRPAEILDTVCDYTKAKTKLHWQPEINMRQGLQEMIEALTTKNKHEG